MFSHQEVSNKVRVKYRKLSSHPLFLTNALPTTAPYWHLAPMTLQFEHGILVMEHVH